MSTRLLRNLSVSLLLALCVVTVWSPRSVVAAPGNPGVTPRFAAQNVDWLSTEQAASLDIGISVLVPSWVPAPFGGSPSIQASEGYYSLYWMNGGGAPTFLEITGKNGGSLPAGSPADLNNQLSINASVQGYDAIHDVTAIYDNVWWIAGGVLYTVSANNMTGTDSLSLANSLIALQPPVVAAPEPTSPPPPPTTTPVPPPPVDTPDTPAPDTGGDTGGDSGSDTGGSTGGDTGGDTGGSQDTGAGPTGSIDNSGSVQSGEVATLSVFPSEVGTLRTTGGYFLDSGQTFITDLTGGEVGWQAPTVDVETTVEFTLLDAQTGIVTDSSSITVLPAATSGGTTVEADRDIETGASQVLDDGTGGSLVTPEALGNLVATQTPASGSTDGASISDGTAGPELPTGSDGTGGIRQIALP